MSHAHTPMEVLIDDDGLTLSARGHQVRIDQLPEGWRVLREGGEHLFGLPDGRGLLRVAVTALSWLQVARTRRRPQRSAGLFTTHQAAFDELSLESLEGILAAMWSARAIALEPRCAPLFGHRPVRQDLWFCGAPAFLASPFLLDDALRFRAARAVWTAAKHHDGSETPKSFTTRLRARRLWRHQLCPHEDQLSRALQCTIERGFFEEERVPLALELERGRHDLVAHSLQAAAQGEGATDAASLKTRSANARHDRYLCSLADIDLVAPLASEAHLELLGEYLAVLPRKQQAAHRSRLALVQRATPQAIDDVIVATAEVFRLDPKDRRKVFLRLAPYLVREDPSTPAMEFRALVVAILERVSSYLDEQRALRAVRKAQQVKTASGTTVALARPPIGVSFHPSVRFLGTAAEVVAEGRAMHHCIATRIPHAVRGYCYLFHVEHKGQRASVEVSRAGDVIEARGPCNEDNGAARFGIAMLHKWGLALAISRIVGAYRADAPLPVLPAAALGPGQTPLLRWVDLAKSLDALPYTNATLRRFLRRAWPLCQAGRGGFVRTTKAVMWLDEDGRPLVSVGREG